mmetsp:Transcript_12438/g.40702  ORF Transcript_12438/g.40702 Transcript_12438/m.40702 type:complete len:330 (-) Transcript_12438:2946-3935(-)
MDGWVGFLSKTGRQGSSPIFFLFFFFLSLLNTVGGKKVGSLELLVVVEAEDALDLSEDFFFVAVEVVGVDVFAVELEHALLLHALLGEGREGGGDGGVGEVLEEVDDGVEGAAGGVVLGVHEEVVDSLEGDEDAVVDVFLDEGHGLFFVDVVGVEDVAYLVHAVVEVGVADDVDELRAVEVAADHGAHGDFVAKVDAEGGGLGAEEGEHAGGLAGVGAFLVLHVENGGNLVRDELFLRFEDRAQSVLVEVQRLRKVVDDGLVGAIGGEDLALEHVRVVRVDALAADPLANAVVVVAVKAEELREVPQVLLHGVDDGVVRLRRDGQFHVG